MLLDVRARRSGSDTVWLGGRMNIMSTPSHRLGLTALLVTGAAFAGALAVAPPASADGAARSRPAVTFAVGSTTTKLTASDRTVKSGQRVELEAKVKRVQPSSGRTLVGSITFTATPATGTPITFTTTTKSDGEADWKVKLPNGVYKITASYAGNAYQAPSTSSPITVKVGSSVVPPTDTDGDRLPDSVETNTGIYVSKTNTGTDPNKADTDGDNIKDGDEVLGTTAGLNLKALGFSANHKDFALEFDWYDDATECGAAHSHRPTPGAIAKMTAAYAAAPLTNPDGTTGIHFIADYGQSSTFSGGSLITGRADGTMDFDFDAPGGGFGEGTPYHTSKLANFDSRRNGIFYYALFGHRFTGPASSALGVGQLNGDDFVMFADCSNANDDLLANATFHELGHDFGLGHGGFDFENFKPNYNSSMNYEWGAGLDNNCDGQSDGDASLGFSSGTRPDLDENALDESVGMCGTPIDWNQNGVIDPGTIAFDLNPSEGFGLTVLKDYNDWANISFAGLNDVD